MIIEDLKYYIIHILWFCTYLSVVFNIGTTAVLLMYTAVLLMYTKIIFYPQKEKKN